MARTLKQQVRKVIKEHYGNALARYARMAGDGKLLDTFVSALAHAIKPYGVRSPSFDCTCRLTWFDGHPTPIDIEDGRRIQSIRLHYEMSLEELGARISVHPGYLDELEQGKLTPDRKIFKDIARAFEAPHVYEYLSQDLDEEAEVEGWVRYEIALYFGRSLWTFHPDVSYEESVGPFVQALVDLGKVGQHAVAPLPPGPPIGYMVKVEEGRRKLIPAPENLQELREAFASHA